MSFIVTVTSISVRLLVLRHTLHTLLSLLDQNCKPDRIVLCISKAPYLIDDVLENIADMYRKQLARKCYRIGDLKKLVLHKHELKEVTDLICQKRPLALGLLASRLESPELSVKKITTQIIHKCISLFRSC